MSHLNKLADSVILYGPSPVCCVGHKPDSDPAEYGVGCNYEITGVTGLGSLQERGFIQIEIGPVTWDACADFMRAHDQERW